MYTYFNDYTESRIVSIMEQVQVLVWYEDTASCSAHVIYTFLLADCIVARCMLPYPNEETVTSTSAAPDPYQPTCVLGSNRPA